MPSCLNPDCDREMPVVGVCLSCANGRYSPKRDGVQVSEEDTIDGSGSRRAGR